MALKRHQRAVRLDRAAFLLEHTHRRISDITASLQFQDIEYFGALFVERRGLTPTEYRQSNRPDK